MPNCAANNVDRDCAGYDIGTLAGPSGSSDDARITTNSDGGPLKPSFTARARGQDVDHVGAGC